MSAIRYNLGNLDLNKDPFNWFHRNETNGILIMGSKSQLIFDQDSIIFDKQTAFDLFT